MAQIIPVDTRRRAVRLYLSTDKSLREVALDFDIAIDTLHRWVTLQRDTGSLDPKPTPAAPPTPNSLLTITPGSSSASLSFPPSSCANSPKTSKMSTTSASPHSILARSCANSDGLAKKPVSHPCQLRSDIVGRRAQHKAMMKVLTTHLLRLVYLDETGIHKHMIRTYARAPKGKRAYCHQKYRGDNYTLIGAISAQKVLLVQVSRGGLKADGVLAFVKELCGHLKGGQAVVMDNVRTHTKVWEEMTQALGAVGCVVVFQPPYSPECNASEKLWSQLKAHIRGWEPISVKCLREALDEALLLVQSQHLAAYFEDARNRVLEW